MSTDDREPQSVLSAGRFESAMTDLMATNVTQATIFTVFALLSVLQLLRQKAWFFGSFTAALVLQATGSIAQTYLAQDETNHTIYVVSFACLTLAPACLALSAISAYRRLRSSTAFIPYGTSYRTLWMPERVAGLFCSSIQLSAMALLAFGIMALWALHSASPIKGREDALARITYEAQALAFLRLGWMIQSLGLIIFIVISSGSSIADYLDGEHRKLYCAINWVSLLNLARSMWMHWDLSHLEPASLDLATRSLGERAVDILPLIVAFALFLRCNPGKLQTVSLGGFDRGTGDRKQSSLLYEPVSNC